MRGQEKWGEEWEGWRMMEGVGMKIRDIYGYVSGLVVRDVVGVVGILGDATCG